MKLYSLAATLYNQQTGDVVESYFMASRPAAPVFIHEFTPRVLERIGEPVVLKLIDTTVYSGMGMERLCLLATLNGDSAPRRVAFKSKKYEDAEMDLRARSYVVAVPFYKSIVLEFDLDTMNASKNYIS